MLRYRLQVTRFDAANNSCDVIQNSVFEVPSDNKHGLQRKAIDKVLASDNREAFKPDFGKPPKWTNEDVIIDGNTIRMMHMTRFYADDVYMLKLHQVDDDTEVTFVSKVRQVNSNKDWFIVEVQDVQAGELTAEMKESLQAANVTAAKLRIKDNYPDFAGTYTSMPFNQGIYRNHSENTSILVLRQATDEEAAELGNEEASE